MDQISVLIVDDSALMRNLIGKIIESTPGLQIADKAMNGKFALQKIARVKPDIIVLDIEMPEMNGVEFLRERKKLGFDIPVIILSSIAKEGAKVTMECLDLGASDFITKPSGSESANIHTVAKQLGDLLLGYGAQYQHKKRTGLAKKLPIEALRGYESTFSSPDWLKTEKKDTDFDLSKKDDISHDAVEKFSFKPEIILPSRGVAKKITPKRNHGPIEIIAIGISTGGPNALREVFAQLDPHLPQPIVVVQHMPAGFTEEFANSLNRICPLEVKEAKHGDLVKPGRVLIAPGNKHLEIEKRTLGIIAKITDEPAQNGHRPSADVLFDSVKREFQNKALGIVMTGMGKDGAVKLAELYEEGSRTLGQDEESSIVYGMPRVAWELGGVMEQVSLQDMARKINELALTYGNR